MKWLMFSLLLLICFILSFRFRTSEADGDIKSDLEETLEANGTSTNDSITNAKEDSSMNKTNFIKPLCTEDGCNPRLNCSNLTSISLINETYMNIFTQPRVVNVSAHQLQYILEDSLFTNSCVLVLFYAAWCPYSIDFTPTYNALAKYFPQLTVLAMDFGNENQERFLLAYIPRILLYYSGRAVYNVDTSLSNETLVKIITNITGTITNLSLYHQTITSSIP
jgi:thiol-disulfide isomerase/thioredoxin